jgi:hypothetical protein
VAYDGDIRKRREHLVEVSASPVITDRLGHFIGYRVEKTMTRLASESAVDRSPGLKSQVSAEGNSDVENMGDPLVSQTTFGTQIPYSPPKPGEKSSPRKTQSLGKRKVMADLRQLVNDVNRAQKKTKFCTEDKRLSNADTMLADVGQSDVPATSVETAVEVESQLKKQDARSSPNKLERPTKKGESPQNLDGAKEHPNSSQVSLTRVASVTTSESRLSGSDCQSNLLSRLRDQLTKTTYLPRYLQKISKTQNDLLATDAKWQPALVGQPTRPGTLPLELITCLTAAADRKATFVCEPVQSNQRVPSSLQDFSRGQASDVDEELDPPSNSPILKRATWAYDQIQSEDHKVESESEGSSVEWSISPSQSSPPERILPPDSSPVQGSLDMLVPSRGAKAAPCESRKVEDPVPPSHSQCSSVKEVEKSSQASPHHSNRIEGSLHTQVAITETSQRLRGKPVSRTLATAAGTCISQEEAGPTTGSNSKSSSVEFATKASLSSAFTSPPDDSTRHLELGKSGNVQVSHTPHIPRMASSSQTSEYPVTTLQRQPTSQQMSKRPSPQLTPGTFLHGIGDSWPIGTRQDEPQPNASMGYFEINSSEDEHIPDANPPKSLCSSQSEDDQADVSQQIMTEIQNASQIPSIAPGNPENPDDGETAHSNHGISNHEAVLEDRAILASDSTSSAKRKLDNADKEELSNHSKRTKLNSTLSVSSEDHDFWRVNNVTGIYRRGVFSSLRTNAAPLSPSTFLGSNISPQSASVQSSDRRQSDHTSAFRQITSSAPLTRMSARDEKIRPTSTSDMSRRSALRPEDQFLAYKQSYPTYGGNLTQFLRSCLMIRKIRAAGKMLPQCVWDDFVHRHHHDYRSHLLDAYKSDELESPMSYEEYYADCVSKPLHVKGIIRLAFIDSLSLKMDPKTTLDTPPVGVMYRLNDLEDSGHSVAASSSASNVQAKEPLPEMTGKAIPKNNSMTLESQLQLREREKTPQSQSSVHLWLQKASGAASPELGTSDSLVAPDNIPCIDLTDDPTENEADFTFDLAQELLPLTNLSADVRRGAPKASLEEPRLPNAKTEPFKHFALEYAKLGIDKHEKLPIQVDTENAGRTNVQRIIDIFTWRA